MSQKPTRQVVDNPGTGRLSDGELLRQWSTLAWQIRQWADRHGNGASTSNPAQDPSLHAQAAVWRTLFAELLPTASHPSGMVSWDVNSGTFKDLAKKAKLFLTIEKNWRAHLSPPGSLAPFTPRNDEIESKAKQLRSKCPVSPKGNDKATRELEEIFRSAIQLQIDLALQTPWWYCEYPVPKGGKNAGIMFDQKTMAPLPNSPPAKKLQGKPVILVISPALNKRGEPQGRKNGPSQILSKSQVVCGNVARAATVPQAKQKSAKQAIVGRAATAPASTSRTPKMPASNTGHAKPKTAKLFCCF